MLWSMMCLLLVSNIKLWIADRDRAKSSDSRDAGVLFGGHHDKKTWQFNPGWKDTAVGLNNGLDSNSIISRISFRKNICHLYFYCDLCIPTKDKPIAVIDSCCDQSIINVKCFFIITSRSGRFYYVVDGPLQGHMSSSNTMEVVNGIFKASSLAEQYFLPFGCKSSTAWRRSWSVRCIVPTTSTLCTWHHSWWDSNLSQTSWR